MAIPPAALSVGHDDMATEQSSPRLDRQMTAPLIWLPAAVVVRSRLKPALPI